MEGQGVISFPLGRMRMENKLDPELGQAANYVLWCNKDFPDKIEISWDFYPVKEPGLCVFFLAAKGRNGEDIFSSLLEERTGPYNQYHHGDINALHISYFRRRYSCERQFHLCNLRKSYGFHLLAQNGDPLPSVGDAVGPYRLRVMKFGSELMFYINDLLILNWKDDGEEFGQILDNGKIGFRQMAPMIGEYGNLEVHQVELQDTIKEDKNVRNDENK